MRALSWVGATVLLMACEPVPGPSDDVPDPVEDPTDCEDPFIGYADLDGDGFGDSNAIIEDCDAQAGAPLAGDCDDQDPAIHPAATETCDGIDQDCNGVIDDDLPTRPFFLDVDGDGFGGRPLGVGCMAPSQSSFRFGDCDDANANAYPGAPEPICTLVDLDCDGEIGMGAGMGERRYERIQDAIDDAPEGETVTVCQGNRVESLVVKRGLKLVGETSNPEGVAIAAPAGKRALTAEGDWITLRGLTFVGDVLEEGDGGAVWVYSNTLHVEGCRIEGGEAARGGGLAWFGRPSAERRTAEVRIEDTWLDGGTAAQGGGAYLDAGEDGGIELDGDRVRENTASSEGGGIYATGRGTFRLEATRTTFQDNASGGFGGAVAQVVRGGSVETSMRLEDVTVTANDSGEGGAIDTPGIVRLQRVRMRSQVGDGIHAYEVTATDSQVMDGSGVAVTAQSTSWTGGSLRRNWGGAFELTATSSFSSVDFAAGADENGSFDVAYGDRTHDWTGIVTATCRSDGSCVER